MRSPSGRPPNAGEWSTASMANPQANCMNGTTPVILRRKRKTNWRLDGSSSRSGRVPPAHLRSCTSLQRSYRHVAATSRTWPQAGPERQAATKISYRRVLRATRLARALRYAVALAYFGHQRGEEFLGQALYHTCDQTRPELRQLSAYLGLYFIGQHGAIPCSSEMDTSTTLGKACDTP